MFCIELGMIGLGQSEVEYYARGGARGLFDEDLHPRDSDGLFAKKGGGAAIADEPFALGQAKPKHGKGGSHEKQGSLFDTDLHGAEARDLPGQTNFLGDEPEDTPATSGIDKSDAPSAGDDDETPEEREKLAMAKDMGMPPENAIGTKAHRLRTMKRLKEFGLSDKSAKWVFQQAMETRHDFDGFGKALIAYAGTAQGIESAPAPAGKKSKGKADWSGRDASGVVDKDTAKLFGA